MAISISFKERERSADYGIAVYINDGSGTFKTRNYTVPLHWMITDGSGVRMLAPADFDGNRTIDLVWVPSSARFIVSPTPLDTP